VIRKHCRAINMGQKETEETQQQEMKMKMDYLKQYQRDVRYFMMNNDISILKRVLFKTFVHQSVPAAFQKDKTHALMMIMISDGNIQTNVDQVI
jgi:hypothetical protein